MDTRILKHSSGDPQDTGVKGFTNLDELFPGRPDLRDRFISDLWEQVDFGSTEDCWIWLAKLNPSANRGVIHFRVPGGYEMLYAHRAVYLVVEGQLPAENLYRLCGEKRCCNPAHMEDGFERRFRLQLP